MSTDAATAASARRRRSRAFLAGFAIVVAALAVVGLAGAAVTVAQGPRVTRVSVDPMPRSARPARG
jgi:NaMN:DMB phosphoribosyltransferase